VRIHDISREFHVMAEAVARANDSNPELARVMNEAHWRLLRAETSCNLYWGEAWIHKSHADLDSVAWHLGEAKAILGERLTMLMTAPEPPAGIEAEASLETAETAEGAETDASQATPVDETSNSSEKTEADTQ
jgi:hypothetical protein